VWDSVVVVVGLPVVAPGLPIYEHIRRHVDPSGRLPADVRLPDDRTPSGYVLWAPGAIDGIFSFHGSGSSPERAAEVARRLVSACRRPSVRNLRMLYEGAVPDGVMGYVDVLPDALLVDPPDRQVLHAIGKWLATTAPDRGPVKLGIALLGITGPGADLAVVRTLGTHEEFTVFCADAMSNGLADPESELWALAASVDGWGRIECVDRLRDTADPDIRSWILREGYRNSVMYEYLAYIAATTGGLLEALRGEVDRGLLTAAGEILAALVDKGGPAEDIDDYESGADAVEAFLTLMTTRAETLRDFSAVLTIRAFLSHETGWDERVGYGWTATRRQAFEDACDQILHRDSWLGLITAELASDDAGEFHLANRAARFLGMSTFDVNVAKIEADPLGDAWFEAWQQADTARARVLANLARTLLPLDRIATGPGDELGLDTRWRAHTVLNWTVQALRDHPGIGADLLLTCLHSPVTVNRTMALHALARWPRATWPPTAREMVRTLAHTDPNNDTRQFARQLSIED
jgi:hypothetical protein